MALYIVVHHQRDPNQPWQNAWHDDDHLEAIQTTIEIGELCEKAKQTGEKIFVHRCAWGTCEPTICCSVDVERVDRIDRRSSLVIFSNAFTLGRTPAFSPMRGQNFYIEEAV